MKQLNITIFVTCLIAIFSCISKPFAGETLPDKKSGELKTNEIIFKWNKISGYWIIDSKKTILTEVRKVTRNRGYSELINYNSITTDESFNAYTKFISKIAIQKPILKFYEGLIFFGVKNFREFYAIKFNGDEEKIHSIEIISSHIKNKSFHPSVKWNYIITEHYKKDLILSYDMPHEFELRFSEKLFSMYIDKKNVLEYEMESANTGQVGFSNRNAQFIIYDVKLFNDATLLISDDFKKDTIRRPQVQMQRRTD